MSTVKANSYYDASGTNNAQLYGVASPLNSMGFRNRVINGDQRFDQRNAGAAVTINSGSGAPNVTDNWQVETSIGAYSAQRSTTAPTGFSNSLQVTVSSTGTPGTTGYSNIYHWIEGFNWADMNYGTASAQTATLSFWVRSSVTGNFSVALVNGNVTFNNNQQYTISSANTWTYVSLVFAPPTSGSNFDTGNGRGVGIRFDLGTGTNFQTSTQNSWVAAASSVAGSVQLITNASATWYVTGVQLEAGSFSSGTQFERRPYTTELALCQRYYEKSYNVDVVPGTNTGVGLMYFITGSATGNVGGKVPFAVSKRATPTITIYPADGSPAGSITTDFIGEVTANVLSQGQSGFSVYVAGGGSSAGAVYGHYVASSVL